MSRTLDATIAGTIYVERTTSGGKSSPYRNRRGHHMANALGTVSLHGYNETSLDEGFPGMGTLYDEKMRLGGPSDSYDEYNDDGDENDGEEENGNDF
ncbi:hypothetical protein GGS21DRAFT_494766 [Xylaria nigripes]|nr:hypothetical protein GGS21DRAFT_494766 [Xylaria nigripes]